MKRKGRRFSIGDITGEVRYRRGLWEVLLGPTGSRPYMLSTRSRSEAMGWHGGDRLAARFLARERRPGAVGWPRSGVRYLNRRRKRR